MREVFTGRVHRGIRGRSAWVRTLVLLLVVGACVPAFAAPAFASPSPAVSGAASLPSEASPEPQTLSCALSASSAVYGSDVTVTGVVLPALADQEVTVKLGDTVLGAATTGADGAYALTFKAAVSGDVVAGLTADPTVVGLPQSLAVVPKVSLSHSSIAPFLPARFTLKVAPLAYDGVVTVKVVHRKTVVGSYKARVKDGLATLKFPLRGVDTFALTVSLPAAVGLNARSLQAKVVVPAKRLSSGSSGPYVKGMLTALSRLRFRVPGIGTRFNAKVKDSVMAFQKAYRLPRSYVFTATCWRKIDGAKIIKPRRSSPSIHLEVDKTRQILMVVKGGKPLGIICVSTGATGNTPEGAFRIQQKHPYTTSGYGGILVRTMGFVGNFAIHGYTPVPPYPASHGCVREPIWACYWVYDHSFVGETLYIYR